MSHNIWSSRFYNRDNKPAWHGLGINSMDPITAQTGIERVGSYEVELCPLYGLTSKGERFSTDYAQIVRQPTADDNITRVFGSPVSSNYELIGPMEAATIWDNAMRDANDGKMVPIETLGVLNYGRELFISAKLSEFDVKGDPIQLYQILHNPMYSNNAASIVRTAFRPVCANTLALGLQNAVVTREIVHIPGAKVKMYEWLVQMYREHEQIVAAAKQDFERMAIKWIKVDDTKNLLSQIIENPVEPKPEWHMQFGISYEQHLINYEDKLQKASDTREAIFDLFSGDGVGMNLPSVDGTAFGLYNAVAEFEDNRRGNRQSTGMGVLLGDRASVIRKAYGILSKFSAN